MLEAALAYLRPEDQLVVWKVDRLGRSLREMINTAHDLQQQGVKVLSQGRRMKSASQKSEHVIIVPGGLLATRPHADPGCSVPPHEVDGDLAQDGQVASCRAIPDAAVILAEGDIEDPMEPIFNRPVPADRLDQHRGVITAA